ncbi:MAG TPA: HemK2/MTQ2 family protein methyltransferase [Candidatus Deferrimicrobium sp.]|nr:HemK2/MTQ2 family protein methyltransferase [Candidatus Deferrimicrobium sp.]
MGIVLEYRGLELNVAEGVYLPSDDSYLLIDNLNLEPDDFVLEIGTGSGLISLIAAQTVRKVIATDVSPIAVICAKENVKRNKLEGKIEVRRGGLFDPINEGEIFDIILFNPPYLPENNKNAKKVSDWLEKAWDGGNNGREIIDPFIENCKYFLKPLGRVLMVQSSLSNSSKSCDLFKNQGFQVEIRNSKSFFFEKIILLHAWLVKK